MTATGMVMIGMIALGMCQRKMQDDEGDDHQLFDQRVLQVLDGAQDQVASGRRW